MTTTCSGGEPSPGTSVPRFSLLSAVETPSPIQRHVQRSGLANRSKPLCRGTSLAGGHLVRGSIVAWHRLVGYGSKWRLAVGAEMQGCCIACRASAPVRGTTHDDHCLPPGQRGWDLMKATKPSRNLRSWPSTVASVSAPAASNTPWARDTMSRPPNHGTVPSVRSTGSQAF